MNNPNGTRTLGRWLVAPAMVGALVGGFGIAAAQTDSPATTGAESPTTTAPKSPTTTAASAPSDAGPRGGEGEAPLTGEVAEKVRAAALAAVPGATVDRLETDNQGSPYEAHLTKADGTHVTVKVNDAFEVTSIDTDPPGGPRGHHGRGGNETPLTGETAEKVRAAALKAVPDATVDRVETDDHGSPYEAHMTKADGSRVTVKVNEAFEVTSVENDPVRPPR